MKLCITIKKSKYCAPACLLVEGSELIVTPPRVMSHPFCYVSGLHQRASTVLGVCEGYDRVEAVSED